jgi:hypothetical protein
MVREGEEGGRGRTFMVSEGVGEVTVRRRRRSSVLGGWFFFFGFEGGLCRELSWRAASSSGSEIQAEAKAGGCLRLKFPLQLISRFYIFTFILVLLSLGFF